MEFLWREVALGYKAEPEDPTKISSFQQVLCSFEEGKKKMKRDREKRLLI